MYEGSHFGAHSYSTPASPSSYNNSNNNNNNNSQPSEGKVGYDKDLAALFRATAANVTQLYKEASDIGNSAYKAGYEQCYHDVCEYLLATSQTEGTVSHADVQQLVMQRLTEFSRLKRIGPRQVHLGGGTSRPPSASSQVYGHQSYSYGQHDHQQNHDYQQQHQQHQQQQQQQHHGRHSLNTQGTAPHYN
ncbi:hypothetical protein IWW45_000249 [Coemansia sp. RSA 485]|nr:hypothetical protein IWW45_000249 [Coemansia sp. RSA 485]